MSVEDWRATIPFTDEEIARALEAEAIDAPSAYLSARYLDRAEQIRKRGRISGQDLRVTLPRLVTHCPCGKKALYRTGYEGRCSDHKHAKSRAELARNRRLRDRDAAIEEERLRVDRLQKQRGNLRANSALSTKGHKPR